MDLAFNIFEQIAKEKEIIQKTLREILYERPDDSIVFKIAKNIYMTKNLKYQTKKLLSIF